MILREPNLSDEQEALIAHEELKRDGFEFLFSYEDGMDWREFIAIQERNKNAIDLPEGRVQATFFFGEVDGQLIGRSSVRHELNKFLAERGGHIGYAVRPQYRNQGFAKQMLKESLQYCKSLGLQKVLITCDDSNAPSWKTIESQGGVLESIIPWEETLVRRYWIDLN